MILKFISLVKSAILLERSGSFTRAFNTYQTALELARNPVAKIKIESKKASCLEQVGNHKESEALINKLTGEYSNIPESYLYSSIYHIKKNSFKTGRKLLEEGLDKFPNFLDFYLTLAFLLRKMDRTNESIEILKKTLHREDFLKSRSGFKKFDIWNELGVMYYDRGNYNSAIACFRKALRDSENYITEFSLVARAYLKIDDPQNALSFMEKQMEIYKSEDPEDFILMARIYCRLRDLQNAGSCLLQAYDSEGKLILKSEDMIDLSELTKSGFFTGLENIVILEE